MIKLMGTEIDHKIDYTYEDLYNIIKKNWKNIEEKLNKQPKHHPINPNQSQQQNPPHISHPFQKNTTHTNQTNKTENTTQRRKLKNRQNKQNQEQSSEQARKEEKRLGSGGRI